MASVQPLSFFPEPDPCGTLDMLASDAYSADRPAEPFPVAPPVEPAEDDHDPRFNAGLLYDVVMVLESHGYRQPEECPGAMGRSLLALGDLVRAFEGKAVRA